LRERKEENLEVRGGKRELRVETRPVFVGQFGFLGQPTKKPRTSSEVRGFLLSQNGEVITVI